MKPSYLPSIQALLQAEMQAYLCQRDLNLYDAPTCDRLATQAAAGRYLTVSHALLPQLADPEQVTALPVCLCEDDYPGWLKPEDAKHLEPTVTPYQSVVISGAEIQNRLDAVIAFTQAAQKCPNIYLWGGTIGPNYDCSGLIQAAFAAAGIWLPRDAYQQEAFTQAIALSELQPGDLVFFGPPEKATHVGLYLGDHTYIHSSGKDQGRNGIGIDSLAPTDDPVSQAYYRQLRGAGRVLQSYQPIAHLQSREDSQP